MQKLRKVYLTNLKNKTKHYEKPNQLFYTYDWRTQIVFKALFKHSNNVYCFGCYVLLFNVFKNNLKHTLLTGKKTINF